MHNNSSNCSVECEVEELVSVPLRDPLYIVVPMTCVYAVILVSGVVGNISTCIVIARNKHMHTATNYYLCSLAVSDLLLLMSGLPVEMYRTWSRYPYVFGELFCRVTGLTSETAANATVLTITAFTIERYVAICHPFISYTVTKLSRALKHIAVIWVLALCLAVPQAIQFGIVVEHSENGLEVPGTEECTLKFQFVQHAFHISSLLFFVGPMTLITALYVLIGLKLRQSKMLKRPSADRSQRRVVRMLVAVVVAFFICWAPFHCQRLLAVYGQGMADPSPTLLLFYNTLTYVSGVLYFLSTTINPLLYHTMSNKFRLAFKSTLASLCSTTHRSSPQSRAYSVLSRAAPPSSFGPISSTRRPPRVFEKKPTVHTISSSSLQETEVSGYELVNCKR